VNVTVDSEESENFDKRIDLTMQTRIISAAVAIVVAIVVLALHNTFVFPIAIAAISVGAVYELLNATGYNKHKIQTILCCSFAGLDCFSYIWLSKLKMTFFNERFILGIFIVAMCVLYLKEHKDFKFTDFFVMIGITYFVNYAFISLLTMNIYKNGLFMVIITLCGAWLADSGAYFAGTFLGKTPLCPEISPKKTVEGLAGGVICNGLLFLIIGVVYEYILGGASVRLFMLFICGMLCALFGLVGDLTASMIKRECGIKDYGNIMPGHGGIMDRFDSVLFVAPFMLYAFTHSWIF